MSVSRDFKVLFCLLAWCRREVSICPPAGSPCLWSFLVLFCLCLFNVPHDYLPIQSVFLCKGSVCCGGSQYLGEDVKFRNQDFVPLVFFFVCHFLFISLFVIFGCKDTEKIQYTKNFFRKNLNYFIKH